jgi:hypothetical protein
MKKPKACEILNMLDLLYEDFIDKFFLKFNLLINYDFKDDTELIKEVGNFLEKEYGIKKFILGRTGNSYDAKYVPGAEIIKVFAPVKQEFDYEDTLEILVAVLHELSHRRLFLSKPSMIKNYKGLENINDIVDHVLQAIERAAYAVSLVFELERKSILPSELYSLVDKVKDLSPKYIDVELKTKFGVTIKNSDIGIVLYALAKSKKRDGRRDKLIKLINKAHRKVSGYMGKFRFSHLKETVII